MRDKARIRRIIRKLERYWLQEGHQDLRLAQMVLNITFAIFANKNPGAKYEPHVSYHVEDDTIEEFLDSALEELVDLEIDISDETFLQLAKMAHERDITINDMIVDCLVAEIERLKEKDV